MAAAEVTLRNPSPLDGNPRSSVCHGKPYTVRSTHRNLPRKIDPPRSRWNSKLLGLAGHRSIFTAGAPPAQIRDRGDLSVFFRCLSGLRHKAHLGLLFEPSTAKIPPDPTRKRTHGVGCCGNNTASSHSRKWAHILTKSDPGLKYQGVPLDTGPGFQDDLTWRSLHRPLALWSISAGEVLAGEMGFENSCLTRCRNTAHEHFKMMK